MMNQQIVDTRQQGNRLSELTKKGNRGGEHPDLGSSRGLMTVFEHRARNPVGDRLEGPSTSKPLVCRPCPLPLELLLEQNSTNNPRGDVGTAVFGRKCGHELKGDGIVVGGSLKDLTGICVTLRPGTVEAKRGKGGGGDLASGDGDGQVRRPVRDVEPVKARRRDLATDGIDTKVGVGGLHDFGKTTRTADVLPSVPFSS